MATWTGVRYSWEYGFCCVSSSTSSTPKDQQSARESYASCLRMAGRGREGTWPAGSKSCGALMPWSTHACMVRHARDVQGRDSPAVCGRSGGDALARLGAPRCGQPRPGGPGCLPDHFWRHPQVGAGLPRERHHGGRRQDAGQPKVCNLGGACAVDELRAQPGRRGAAGAVGTLPGRRGDVRTAGRSAVVAGVAGATQGAGQACTLIGRGPAPGLLLTTLLGLRSRCRIWGTCSSSA